MSSAPCPTCGGHSFGSQLPQPLRKCAACACESPSAFTFCGHCGQRFSLQGAAHEQSWPSLAGELVELRFFLQQGQLSDAHALLELLRRRYPGHPELGAFERTHRSYVAPELHAVVDQVLASSNLLEERVPRRAAPRWDAPRAGAVTSTRTQVHEAVPKKSPLPLRGRKAEVVVPRPAQLRALVPTPMPDRSSNAHRTQVFKVLDPATVGTAREHDKPRKRRWRNIFGKHVVDRLGG